MNRYPIEQEDIDRAIERLKQRAQQKPKRWTPRKPLTLNEAAKRLNDDKVFVRASKGMTSKDLDD